MQNIWDQIQSISKDAEEQPGVKVWDVIESEIAKDQAKSKTHKYKSWLIGVSIAASFALLFMFNTNKVSNSKGQMVYATEKIDNWGVDNSYLYKKSNIKKHNSAYR